MGAIFGSWRAIAWSERFSTDANMCATCASPPIPAFSSLSHILQWHLCIPKNDSCLQWQRREAGRLCFRSAIISPADIQGDTCGCNLQQRAVRNFSWSHAAGRKSALRAGSPGIKVGDLPWFIGGQRDTLQRGARTPLRWAPGPERFSWIPQLRASLELT